MRLTFGKAERLKSQKAIEALFHSGHQFTEYPFKVLWRETEAQESPVQLAISIPKRRFKKAVHRNLLKRRSKEAYRQHKTQLYHQLSAKGIHLQIMLIYIAAQEMEYQEIAPKIILILQRLQAEYE